MDDLTIAEVLRDPLIRLLVRADGVSLSQLATLLDHAARKQSQAAWDGTVAAVAMRKSGEALESEIQTISFFGISIATPLFVTSPPHAT